MNGKVMAIHNFKGGVGKTTLTAVLGMGLAVNYRVLLIDFDPQMSLTQIFVKEERRKEILQQSIRPESDRSAYALIREISDVIVENFIHVSKTSKGEVRVSLDIIPGSYVSTFHAMFKGYFPMFDEFAVKKELENFREKYDFILIDTSPSDVVTIKPVLRASDYLIIPEDGTIEAFNAMLIFLKEALPKYIWSSFDNPRVLGSVITKVRRNSTKLLLEHNKLLLNEISENTEVMSHIYDPPYFGVNDDHPEDFILSSNKEYLSDLIWRNESIPPIGEVFDKLFLVSEKLQPDLYSYFYKVFYRLPSEVVRRVREW